MSKTKKETRGFRAVRKRVGSRIVGWLHKSAPLVILAAFSVCLTLLFPYDDTVQKLDLPKAGTASKETVIAPFTFDILRSQDELDRERRRAMDQVLLVMDYDTVASAEAMKKIAEIWAAITNTDENAPDSLREAYGHILARELSDRVAAALRRRPALFNEASLLLTVMMERGVSATLLFSSNEELNERRLRYNTNFEHSMHYSKRFVTLVRPSGGESTVAVTDIPVKEAALEQLAARLRREQRMDDEGLNVIYELLHACVRPNVRVNNKLTTERRNAAAAEVLETSGKVIKDTEIVRKHQEVTQETVQKLLSLHKAIERVEGAVEERRTRAGFAGRVALVLIALFFLSFYIKKYKPSLVRNPKKLIALSLIVLMQLGLIWVGTEVLPALFETWELPAAPEYLIPVTAAPLLCTLLFGMQVSVLVSLFTAIYFGVVTGFNHYFFLYAFMNSVVAAFLNYRIRYRWHFFKAIPPMFLLCVGIIAVWHTMGWRFDMFLVNIGCAFMAILASVFLTMMLAPFFERVFDITTDMTLIELSDMNHPILKKLSIEAAGTYNHCVLVGNLAESAAQAIGANALLARVASYYHDIGKIGKPDYFVENCLGDRNRHNKLTPTMSALIICSHVKDGVELAKKHGLPKLIRDMIEQHHGTSSVSFFYEKALELDPHKQVQEKDFRYPGPPPQTREAAIIMLADSVEAASRSLATSSPKLLRELVKKIIRDKFMASQLDQCNLTLRDLNDITDGFMPVLQGIFHSRIEYPNK
ncbi:MAG: HDIG domain-containing protein [Chitinispirillia bacterium]|nr:HDIG domain-containing protein [Chitinispirillia bacterium]MCL2269444.1 HDIG domain-containing protein [Chitinispirillia bacterium]